MKNIDILKEVYSFVLVYKDQTDITLNKDLENIEDDLLGEILEKACERNILVFDSDEELIGKDCIYKTKLNFRKDFENNARLNNSLSYMIFDEDIADYFEDYINYMSDSVIGFLNNPKCQKEDLLNGEYSFFGAKLLFGDIKKYIERFKELGGTLPLNKEHIFFGIGKDHPTVYVSYNQKLYQNETMDKNNVIIGAFNA